VGGLQAMAVGLAGALDRERFACHFYSFDAEGPLTAELDRLGLSHVHLPRRPGVDRGYAARLAARWRTDRIQLVHCHNVTAMFHGSRAAWNLGRLPVLFTEHDREMPAPWRHRLLHRWLVRRVDRVAVVSAGLADELVRYEGFPRDRTVALVNGIPDPMRRARGDRKLARAALGWSSEPVVLAVGSLTEVKNHAGLLAAWEGCAARGRARLAIAGEGPLEGALQQQLRVRGLDRVQLLGRRDDVPRLLAAADVFVLPSHREGLSLSLVEAHAMARPSVAFDVGGNGEVLQHERTGLLVPPGNQTGLAGALARLLDDLPLARQLGPAARERYLAHFTHARMVEQYLMLYESMLGARTG